MPREVGQERARNGVPQPHDGVVRHALAGILDPSAATLAHTELVALPVDLCPYAGLAERVWQLRANITGYDAAYVALAELLTHRWSPSMPGWPALPAHNGRS